MNKTRLSALLLATGAVAFTGLAQAQQTSDVPLQAGEASTMTGGAPNALTTNSPYEDNGTLVLQGTPQVTTTTRTYVYRSPVYTYPATPYVYYANPAPIVSYSTVPSYSYVVPSRPHGSASETSNVPERAGEASTMTGGAPNLETQNPTVIGSTVVPYYDPYARVYVY